MLDVDVLSQKWEAISTGIRKVLGNEPLEIKMSALMAMYCSLAAENEFSDAFIMETVRETMNMSRKNLVFLKKAQGTN